MPTPSTVPEIVRVIITVAPWLVDVPVLGVILTTLSGGGGGNELEAVERMAQAVRERKEDRDRRIERNGRYVLKAADAMQCVEDNLMQGSLLVIFAKALVDVVAGRAGGSVLEVVTDRIFTCIESKVLKQTGPRRRKTGRWYGRPARGHGNGLLQSKDS